MPRRLVLNLKFITGIYPVILGVRRQASFLRVFQQCSNLHMGGKIQSGESLGSQRQHRLCTVARMPLG